MGGTTGRSKDPRNRRTSRERSNKHRSRRSPSQADSRKPRTTGPSPSIKADSDYDSYEDDEPLVRVESRKDKAEYGQGRDELQPYPVRNDPSSKQRGEPSATSHRPHSSRRPSTQSHTRGKHERHEEQSFAPERSSAVASLTENLDSVQIGDNYALSASPDLGNTHSSRPGTSEYGKSPRAAGSAQAAAEVGYDELPPTHSTSEYDQSQLYSQPLPTPVYPLPAVESANSSHSTPLYYPPSAEATHSNQTTSHNYPGQPNLSPSQQPHTAYAYCYPPTQQATQQGVTTVGTYDQTTFTPGDIASNAQQGLDKSFKVRYNDYMEFFRVGKVFMTLWTEQLGANAKQDDMTHVSEGSYGEKLYSKPRRFIVVRQDRTKRFATCLPITSYNGSGLGKKNIQLDEHGFIYSRKEPKTHQGLRSKALKVILSPKGKQVHLTDPSLVNYGKVHTVEANWKVKEIGDLDDESRKTLLRYFGKVFGFVKDDLTEPGMTPHAKEAVLAHVGEGFSNYSQEPVPGTYQSTATSQQHFSSVSPPAGFPPVSHESSAGAGGSVGYSSPASMRDSTYGATGYDQPSTQSHYLNTAQYQSTASYQNRSPYHGTNSAQGVYSYQGVAVAMAPTPTFSASTYNTSQGGTTGGYQQYATNNPQVGGGVNFGNYQSQPIQSAWLPPAQQSSTSNTGQVDTYGYPITSSDQQSYAAPHHDSYNQYGYPNATGAGSSYHSQPGQEDSVIAGSPDAEIELPTLENAREHFPKNRCESHSGRNNQKRRK